MYKDEIELIMKSFTQYKDFIPLCDEENKVKIDEKDNIMMKDYFGTMIALELINGDLFSEEEIKQYFIDVKQSLLNTKKNTFVYSFGIFIFQNDPPIEIIKLIEDNQVNKVAGRKYLRSIVVNLEKQSVMSHFKTKKDEFGVKEHLNKYFSEYKKIDNSSASFEDIVEKKKMESRVEFKSQKPVITYILIALNLLIFALMGLYSWKSGTDYNTLLLEFGSKENEHILQGEYWRFIAPIFLHVNIVHVALNCYSLYLVGILAEKIFGKGKFIAIYFAAGILGNIFSFAFNMNPGAGASGAIFGLFGAILFICIEKPALFKSGLGYNIVGIICINLFYGFTKSGIDNFAHLGGLIGGLTFAGIFNESKKRLWYFNRYVYLLLAVIITSSTVFWGFNNTQSKEIRLVTELEQYFNAQNWKEAEKISKEILELNPSENIKIYTLKCIVNSDIYLKKYDDAVNYSKDLEQLDLKDGHYCLGIVYYNMKKFDLAKEEILKAKDLGANYNNIDTILKSIK
ncbi:MULTISPECIES: rhomboid family intramembrane serine protease [unclassified Clostridium]|uniref:rhomboid family protein n=1 Tax=unclassified Clostridium TaxID=2614128 RepID=UPI000297BB77|nr:MULTISPECIES: rhomboid family intramembrane serine protease [unclassified Clostridium]EKQ56119.1 MAG: putative membrane protein [Clostridium sp. Maddingley MBC34-26]